MVDIDIDKSRAVRIKARVNEASVPQVFIFMNEDGSVHDITAYDFQLLLQKRANSSVKLFTLTIGAGLTVVDSNKLLIEVTAEQATQTADSYFWRLRSVLEDHTWLNGPWEFHNGESDAAVEEDEIIISSTGAQVTIIISSGTTIINGGDVSPVINVDGLTIVGDGVLDPLEVPPNVFDNFGAAEVVGKHGLLRMWDNTKNTFPDPDNGAVGSGLDGAIEQFNRFIGRGIGQWDVRGTGDQPVNDRAIFIAMVDTPGNDPVNWLYQEGY